MTIGGRRVFNFRRAEQHIHGVIQHWLFGYPLAAPVDL